MMTTYLMGWQLQFAESVLFVIIVNLILSAWAVDTARPVNSTRASASFPTLSYLGNSLINAEIGISAGNGPGSLGFCQIYHQLASTSLYAMLICISITINAHITPRSRMLKTGSRKLVYCLFLLQVDSTLHQ